MFHIPPALCLGEKRSDSAPRGTDAPNIFFVNAVSVSRLEYLKIVLLLFVMPYSV